MRPSAPPLLTDAVAPVARPGPLAGALGYAALVFALWSAYVAVLSCYTRPWPVCRTAWDGGCLWKPCAR